MSERKERNGNKSSGNSASTPQPMEVQTPVEPQTLGRPEPYPCPVERTALHGSSLTRHLSVDSPATDWPTNLDLTVPREKALLFAAGNPGDYEFTKENTVDLVAHHWLAFPEERVSEETGEVSVFARVVLYDKNGRFFRTSSEFAPKRLKAAIELFSPEDWKAGIHFRILRRPSKRHPGGTYHDIRVVVDEQFQPPAE